MQWKTDALVLRTADFGEYDKMITLLTVEQGKVSACLRGVRRAGAKLKFAAQPFCFAEFMLATRGARSSVISATLHDGFYPLRERVKAYYAGSAVLECCNGLMPAGLVNPEMLLLAVHTLGDMCTELPEAVLVRFLMGALALAGYPVRAEAEDVRLLQGGRVRFDPERGCFCEAGGAERTLPVSESTLHALIAAAGGGLPDDPEGIRRALRLLSAYLWEKSEVRLGALAELNNML